jgi:Fur family ferric uptake transcriptional regulator
VPHAPHTPPLPFSDLDEITDAVRRAGGRLSAPRRRVLEALFAADGPVSADALAHGGAGGGTLELSSVYRSLEHLEALGVVAHVHLGHGPGLYALTGGSAREHLVCERCDRVTSVDPGELDGVRDLVRERFGHHARFSHFPIVGLCAACAAAERDAPG